MQEGTFRLCLAKGGTNAAFEFSLRMQSRHFHNWLQAKRGRDRGYSYPAVWQALCHVDPAWQPVLIHPVYGSRRF